MSILVLSWVLKHSEARLGARLTLIALAEFAHDDGTKAFPSVLTLVERTRLSKSAVKTSLKRLVDDGMIEATGSTRSGTTVYRVIMTASGGGSDSGPGQKLTGAGNPPPGGQNLAGGGPESGPDPLGNHQGSVTGSGDRARALRIAGRPVKPETWRRTVAALNAFNAQAGRSFAAVTGTGDPSEAATRIYQRLARWPTLDDAAVADVIARTLASHWWGSGPASIGVVFGPKVFEDNLSRSPEPLPSGVTQLHSRRMSNADAVDARFMEIWGEQG